MHLRIVGEEQEESRKYHWRKGKQKCLEPALGQTCWVWAYFEVISGFVNIFRNKCSKISKSQHDAFGHSNSSSRNRIRSKLVHTHPNPPWGRLTPWTGIKGAIPPGKRQARKASDLRHKVQKTAWEQLPLHFKSAWTSKLKQPRSDGIHPNLQPTSDGLQPRSSSKLKQPRSDGLHPNNSSVLQPTSDGLQLRS